MWNNEYNIIRNTRLLHSLSLLVITFPLVQCQIIKMTTADNFQMISMKMIGDTTWLSQQSMIYILYFLIPWKPTNKRFSHFVTVHQVLKSSYFYHSLQWYGAIIFISYIYNIHIYTTLYGTHLISYTHCCTYRYYLQEG